MPETRPLWRDTDVTLMPSMIVAPPVRAPRASDCVRSVGFALPSPGIHTAPARSSVRRIGANVAASDGVMNSNSTPKLFARAIWRFISVRRSGVRATFRLPHCFQPVARPVSRSSVAYSSMP
jgi:hypothetical protein